MLSELHRELRDRQTKTSKFFRRIIEVIDLSVEHKVVFVDRYIGALERLERVRKKTRAAAGIGNTIVQIGSVITPALISIQHIEESTGGSGGIIFWLCWGTSVLTGISTTLLSLFKINKKEAVYSNALRKLESEGFRYVELSDRYRTDDPVDAHERLFSTFFTHVESILLDETRVNGENGSKKKNEDEKELKEIDEK